MVTNRGQYILPVEFRFRDFRFSTDDDISLLLGKYPQWLRNVRFHKKETYNFIMANASGSDIYSKFRWYMEKCHQRTIMLEKLLLILEFDLEIKPKKFLENKKHRHVAQYWCHKEKEQLLSIDVFETMSEVIDILYVYLCNQNAFQDMGYFEEEVRYFLVDLANEKYQNKKDNNEKDK
jgi:hypothetical protein